MERDVDKRSFSCYTVLNFNSHAHVERDETVPDVDTICTDFNSHAHVERDFEKKDEEYNLYISTHTLTWSVTFVKLL